jgi:DNA repair protein RadD
MDDGSRVSNLRRVTEAKIVVNLLHSTLERIGATDLVSILGPDVAKLLQLIDKTPFTSSKVASLVLGQLGVEGILFEIRLRNMVLEALGSDDAERLTRLLGMPECSTPWAVLCSRPFRRGSREAELLLAFFGQPAIRDEGVKQTSAASDCNPQFPLFPHQIVAAESVSAELSHLNRPRVLLHMPTGAGKTRTAMNVVAGILRRLHRDGAMVLWLAHSEELCEQAVEEFVEAWSHLGNQPLPVVRLFGDHSSNVGLSEFTRGFVVGGLQLLHSRSKSEQGEFLEFANRVRLVVMDEAHMAMAPSYQHLLRMLAADPQTGVLGLSATPGRSTLDASQDVALADFFNRKKVTLQVPGYDNPVEFLQAEGYLAKIEFDRVPYSPSKEFSLSPGEAAAIREGFDLPYEVIRRLGVDVQRNFLILNRIKKEAQTGAKILVFGCSVDHAKLIANLLIAQGLKAAVVTSETRSDRRRQIIRDYRDSDEIQILTNYGVLTTGFDAPRTSVAVITRPTNSVVLYSQMIGRAARGIRAGGNSTCKVITVVDAIPGFRSMAEAFSYWDDIWE